MPSRTERANVALCEEGVDRNASSRAPYAPMGPSPSAKRAWIEIRRAKRGCLRPRSPSAKRAWIEIPLSDEAGQELHVALCEEGVDRNSNLTLQEKQLPVALCEEGVDRNVPPLLWLARPAVALCEEGVDRNRHCGDYLVFLETSPSAKRAWIEITCSPAAWISWAVALCEEGVDRNQAGRAGSRPVRRRPLRRGRG